MLNKLITILDQKSHHNLVNLWPYLIKILSTQMEYVTRSNECCSFRGRGFNEHAHAFVRHTVFIRVQSLSQKFN